MLLDKKWFIFQSVLVVLLISFVSSQQWGGKKKEGCVKTNLKNGKIKPRSNGRVVKYSCNRDYILVGESTSTCLQGEWTSETPVCVAKGCPPLPPPPSGRLAPSIGGAVQRVECNPGYYLSGSPMLFCDKYDWNGTVPLCRASGILPSMSCNMESEDLCGWIQDSSDDFDWTLNNYGTPSSHLGTGPSFDHTLGAGKGGYYLFMESSSPRLLNDTARLYSPVYSPPEIPMDPTGVGKNMSCFTFWYHMYGSTTGRLHVYIKMESSRLSSVLPAFVRSGDQGNQWRQGYVSIPGNLTENFQMVIEGVRGSGYVGDTAIDDVWLGSGIECQNAKDRMDAESKGSFSGNSTARGSTVTTSTMAPASSASCYSRCSSPPDASASCGCLDDCLLNGSCCSDYAKHCLLVSSTTQTKEEISTTSTTMTLSTTVTTPKPTLFTLSLKPTMSTTVRLPSTQTTTSRPLTNSTSISTLTSTTSAKPTTSTVKLTSTVSSSTTKPTTTFISTVKLSTTVSPSTTKPTTTFISTVKLSSTVSPSTTSPATSTTPSRPSTTTRPVTSTFKRTTETTTTATSRPSTVTIQSSSVSISTATERTLNPQDDVQGDEQPSIPSRVYDDSDTKSKGRIVMVGAITGGVVGAVLILASIIVVVLRVRRNKIARIVNHQQDRLAEDSDVRYLRDEDDVQLDLTEATPSSISTSRRFTDFQQL